VRELVSMLAAEVVQMCLAVERGRMPEAGQSRNRSPHLNRVHLNRVHLNRGAHTGWWS